MQGEIGSSYLCSLGYCSRRNRRDRSGFVQAISRRLQIELIGAGYAAVTMYAVFAFFQRYLYTLREPVDSAGGMAAFGDEMLTLFVFALFLVPTFFLLRLMAQSEPVFSFYAKLLLAVSFTAPLSVALLLLFHRFMLIQNICVTRLWRSPCVVVVFAMSRILGRRSPKKKLITWALLIEAGTLIASAVVFMGMARSE